MFHLKMRSYVVHFLHQLISSPSRGGLRWGFKKMQKVFNSKHLLEKRKHLRNNLTPQEIILWSILRKEQLGCKFRRQHSIGNYIVDFYCPAQKLIIELDGSQHKREKDRKYDLKRTQYFESLGLRTVRFWNNEVNENLKGVILKIEECLK